MLVMMSLNFLHKVEVGYRGCTLSLLGGEVCHSLGPRKTTILFGLIIVLLGRLGQVFILISWIENIPLKIRFHRLFTISRVQDASMG